MAASLHVSPSRSVGLRIRTELFFRFRGGINTAGLNKTSNHFSLNGFNNNDAAITGLSLRSSVDAIEEFKVYMGTYELNMATIPGGRIVASTKSGDNKFHGTSINLSVTVLWTQKAISQSLKYRPSSAMISTEP